MTSERIAVFATCRRGHRWRTEYEDRKVPVSKEDNINAIPFIRYVAQKGCPICGAWYIDLELAHD